METAVFEVEYAHMAEGNRTNKWLVYLQQGATFLFLAYVLYLLGRSAWQNVQGNREVDALRAEIAALRQDNEDLANLILYEQTSAFRELEARRKLGIKRPGEFVIALPTEPDQQLAQPDKSPARAATTEEILRSWVAYYRK